MWMAVVMLALTTGVMAQETETDQGIESPRDVESDWNDFLHYTMIGRFDLAQGFGQRLLESNPDPLLMLELSEQNPKGYKTR